MAVAHEEGAVPHVEVDVVVTVEVLEVRTGGPTVEAAEQRRLGELGGGPVVNRVVADARKAADMQAAVAAADGTADGLRICVATVGGGVSTTAPVLVLNEDMLVGAYQHNVVS